MYERLLQLLLLHMQVDHASFVSLLFVNTQLFFLFERAVDRSTLLTKLPSHTMLRAHSRCFVLPISAHFKKLLRTEAYDMRIHFAHSNINTYKHQFSYLSFFFLLFSSFSAASLKRSIYKRHFMTLNKRRAYKAMPTLFSY